ncbi:hypothetical protein KA531_01840 [Candidatus Saccharibacteria bacterium]|nr:hypothetical protein [Candidatus Saccharibacteria bacterium]
MPRKNSRNKFDKTQFYLIYNNSDPIIGSFKRPRDYQYFLRLLNYYLTSNQIEANAIFYQKTRLPKNDFSKTIRLLSYCLLPNSYYLLFEQKVAKQIPKLMQLILTNYSQYYHQQYSYTGKIFTGSYRTEAINQNDDLLLAKVSRFIHLKSNLDSNNKLDVTYPYSDLLALLRGYKDSWISYDRLLEVIDTNSANYYQYLFEIASNPQGLSSYLENWHNYLFPGKRRVAQELI